jgi:hypothetical protein
MSSNQKHPSHITCQLSNFEEKCIHCGSTGIQNDWRKLAYECPNREQVNKWAWEDSGIELGF